MDEVGFADFEAGAVALALVAQVESAAAALANLDHETLPAFVLAALSLRNESALSLLECHAAATVASLDRTGWVAAHQGLRSVPGWVAHERKARRSPVARSLTLGAAMRAMPATFAAWRTGRLSTEHVSLLVVAASGRRRTLFPEFESDLVEAAQRFCFEDFTVIVRHWMGLADPDGAAAESQAAIDARSWKCSETLGC